MGRGNVVVEAVAWKEADQSCGLVSGPESKLLTRGRFKFERGERARPAVNICRYISPTLSLLSLPSYELLSFLMFSLSFSNSISRPATGFVVAAAAVLTALDGKRRTAFSRAETASR